MKYWGFLAAKLMAGSLLLWVVWAVIRRSLFHPAIYFGQEQKPFAHDLAYTIAMLFFFLACEGVLYVVIWDQRYRCRTCLRRLRMPVAAGSWPNMVLFGQPRTEYICVYGHGTLRVPDVRITGKGTDWQPHDSDIWKELEGLEETRK